MAAESEADLSRKNGESSPGRGKSFTNTSEEQLSKLDDEDVDARCSTNDTMFPLKSA
jgi:hypothetical protein